MRITGLASGMDTETMIKDMMKAHRIPLDKITQNKQYTEWQRDDYRTVNKKLFDFRNLVSDSLNRQSTYIQKTVTTSNPDAVSIKNLTATSDFTGTIKVENLAKTAGMQSSGSILASSSDINKKLSEVKPGLKVPASFTVKAIQADGKLSDGYKVEINEDTTLQNIIDDLNKNSGVNAVYDSFTGKLAITAKNSGESSNSANEIEFDGDFSKYFLKLDDNNELAASATDAQGNPSPRGTSGGNAEFTINGLKTERTSNTVQIGGFEITLKKANPTEEITFSSSPDTDKILEKVVKFVDEYNKMIENFNTEIREKKYKDFAPLSAEQKKELSEKEVELWEEKAKSGTLRNDSMISSALNSMRSILNSKVTTSTGDVRLSDLGITTSTNYMENGKLVIDEGKLREAISSDPNKIYELFSTKETGLGQRLVKEIDETRKDITAKAGSDSSVNNASVIGRLLNNYDKEIERFEDKLTRLEDRYYRQFAAMESAIQRANSQSAYLSNMFTS